jgi:hypothetical protein
MLDPLATGAALYGRGDFKVLADDVREETLWLLGVGGIAKFDALPAAEISVASVGLESSGLYCMANPSREQLVMDAGPQGTATAGHGHSDALSICVNGGGRALLIDPGTFEYVGGGPERNQFRGTSAHNTLQVDGRDQADPRGPFAWGKLPHSKVERWITGEGFDYFAGSHDGYCRLQSPVIHRRFVFSLKSSFWLVRDVAEGASQHRLDLFWHLSPRLEQSGQALEFLDQQDGLALSTMEEHGWKQETLTGVWSPAYGHKEPAPVVHFGITTTLPAEFVTMLVPMHGVAGHKGVLRKIEAIGESDWVRGYRYETAGEEHCFVFASAGRSWSLGQWTSDAELVYLSLRPEGRRKVILCQGSYIEIGGQRMVYCSRPTAWCEMIEESGRTELHSSDKSLITEYLPLDNIGREPEPALSGNGAATKRMDN